MFDREEGERNQGSIVNIKSDFEVFTSFGCDKVTKLEDNT